MRDHLNRFCRIAQYLTCPIDNTSISFVFSLKLNGMPADIIDLLNHRRYTPSFLYLDAFVFYFH
jgi:hypothetical protein